MHNGCSCVILTYHTRKVLDFQKGIRPTNSDLKGKSNENVTVNSKHYRK